MHETGASDIGYGNFSLNLRDCLKKLKFNKLAIRNSTYTSYITNILPNGVSHLSMNFLQFLTVELKKRLLRLHPEAAEYGNFRQEMTSPDSRSNHSYETHSAVKEHENSAALNSGSAKTGTKLAAGTNATAFDKDTTAASSTAAAARLAAGKSQAVDEVDGKVTQLLGKEYQMRNN